MTRRGHAFDPKSGRVSQIDILDIAHALSNMCRYSGHCKKFYSVAEHSVLVSNIVKTLWPDDVDAQWAGLLHDATEAYVGDVTTPLKVLLPAFIEIEDRLAVDIAKTFKIKWTKRTVERVKIADMIALSTEARKLFADVSHWDSIRKYEPRSDLLNSAFPMQSHERARRLFLREFRKVGELKNAVRQNRRRLNRS